jgi:hypothetical protein
VLLICKKTFGNFVPGDEVEVPDGAAFDTTHFEMAQAPVKKDKANAS